MPALRAVARLRDFPQAAARPTAGTRRPSRTAREALLRQRRADQRRVAREAAAAALGGELVDEADRQRRVGEDRRADLDRDRADGEEVEHVGELRHAPDRDDRDVDDLADLVHDPQRDRLDRRARTGRRRCCRAAAAPRSARRRSRTAC